MNTPFPYQETGAAHLYGLEHGYLGDGMGLGKTVQSIMAARLASARHALVIAPPVAVPNWEALWEEWDGPCELEVMSYATLAYGKRKPRRDRHDLVVLDEAHYCKSVSAQRTRAAFKVARRAAQVHCLSGTPMPNHPGEFWAPVRALWPEIAEELGITRSFDWFDHFTRWRPAPHGPKPFGIRNGKQLRELLSRFMLRRHAKDVGLELPPLRVHLSWLPSTPSLERQLREYREYDAEEVTYTSTLRRVLGAVKAPVVGKLLVDELADQQYEKLVVLYFHTDTGRILRETFLRAGLSVVGFDGGAPSSVRRAAQDEFQKGDAQVFLAQQVAAGISIDLHAASEIVLIEPDWTPDANAQFIKRIHRIGQDHPCRARLFAVPGTIDADVMTGIHVKSSMQEETGLK